MSLSREALGLAPVGLCFLNPLAMNRRPNLPDGSGYSEAEADTADDRPWEDAS